jgi:polyhydroxybutyrate depolymerase
MMRTLAAVVALSMAMACGSTAPAPAPTPGDAGADAGREEPPLDGGVDAGVPDAGPYVADPLITARPYAAVVPVGYAKGTPTPLVVLLHGYTATAAEQDAYFKLSALAQQRTFLLALPDGTKDNLRQQFWNATDACCAFGETVDDVAYLTAVIRDMQARFSVDAKRIFLVGHSNGGFMSHRLACDRSELIAGIVSLAGAVWADTAKCNPAAPVNVLQVHGTLDAVIKYGGGAAKPAEPPHPGAETTVETWARKNGCTGAALERITGDLDLVTDLALSETQRLAYTGCPNGAAAELWKIQLGSHLPLFNADWAPTLYNWLMAHPKP